MYIQNSYLKKNSKLNLRSDGNKNGSRIKKKVKYKTETSS